MKRILLALLLLATPAQAQVYRPLTGYSLAFTSATHTVKQNWPLRPNTRIARLLCTVTCHVAFVVTPILNAVTVTTMLAPLWPEYFKVTPGTYVYVRGDNSSGIINVVDME